MSFDLAFWREAPGPSDESAAETYDRLVEGETGVASADESVQLFLNEVLRVYPDLNADNLDTSPWSSSIYSTSECVIVTISGSRSEEVFPILSLRLPTNWSRLTRKPEGLFPDCLANATAGVPGA